MNDDSRAQGRRGAGPRYGGGMVPRDSPDQTAVLRDLLASSAQGDRSAFTRLYDLTSPRIYGLALRVVYDRAHAEEVVQEAYLQFWQKAGEYRPERGSVISWMMTITHRRAVDRVRSEQVHRRRIADYGTENVEVPEASPLEVVEANEQAATLRNCMGQLTDLQRNTIAMAYFSGLSYPEVAEQTGTPLPTIKSRIRDGLRGLRNCLKRTAHA